MILPPELSLAVEEEAARIQPRDLADAARDLSQAYRGESLAPRFRTHVHRVAYCVTRMSATYAAVHTALANILPSRADPPIHTVLDLGAGPGTASWAACELIPSPARINLIERDGLMANLGKRLALGAPYAPLQDAGWIVDEFADQAELPQSDLVILSYSLGEVEEARRLGIAAKAWSAARWGLLLVEPGTPAGFGTIRSVRSHLISLGAAVAAPCPHNRDCPLAGSDWCHFAVRVGRTRRHRLAKGGELGWEDEKFSYCGFVRSGAPAAAARIIRPPKVTKGEVALSLCAATGLEDRVIPRRNAAEYRSARKLRWGDGV